MEVSCNIYVDTHVSIVKPTSFCAVIQAPKLVRELLDKIMGDLDGLLGELGKEMRAIADYWQVDLGIIVTLNFAYELRRVSTS